MILHGIDTSNVIKPLLLDANGYVIVTSKGIVTNDDKLNVNTSGELKTTLSYPHSWYSISGVSQILKDNVADNTETTIHTVTSSKVFYMTNVILYGNNTTGAIGATYFRIYDTTPSIVTTWYLAVLAGSSVTQGLALAAPVALPASYSVRVFSNAAGFVARAAITGYEL